MIIDTRNKKEEEKIPTFYKIKKCSKINYNGTADFETIDGEIIPLNYVSIADTSYYTIFESIFYKDSVDQEGTQKRLKEGDQKGLKEHRRKITGKDRLKKFINELLLPSIKKNEGIEIEEEKIEELEINEIEYVPYEMIDYKSAFNKGTIRFDVPCQCKLSIINEKDRRKPKTIEFGVNIEMQVKYSDDFLYNSLKYCYSLENAYSQPFVVISLLNDIENKKEDNIDKENETKEKESDKESKDKKRRKW